MERWGDLPAGPRRFILLFLAGSMPLGEPYAAAMHLGLRGARGERFETNRRSLVIVKPKLEKPLPFVPNMRSWRGLDI